jgi:hypothetical protein
MKVAVPPPNKPKKVDFKLCIPLEGPPQRSSDDDAEKATSFTCKMNPKDKNSAEYVKKIYPFGDDGGCEQLLITLNLMTAVIKGQGLKSNEQKVELLRQIFQGSVLAAFENEMPKADAVDQTIEDDAYEQGIESMKKVVFPDKAARNQKKAMRKLKKPVGMKFRDFANRVRKINEYLPLFPALGNGNTPTALDDEELHELLHDALPKVGYQDVMQRHDYDPTQDDFHKFVDWIERRCEPFDNKGSNEPAQEKQPPRKNGNNKRKSATQPESGEGKTTTNPHKRPRKYCLYHKHSDHTSEECKVLKGLVKNAPPHKKFEKKTNDFNHVEEVFKSEEFQTMIQKGVAKSCSTLFKAFKKELAEDMQLLEISSSKRKAEEPGELAEDLAYEALLKLNEAPDDEAMADAKASDGDDY